MSKDLAEVFEEQKTRIEALETKFAEFEQRKPYGKPYGLPFIKSVIALIRKTGVKGEGIDELIEKLEKLGEGAAGEQKYPAPVIAKMLRYLKGKLDAKAFKHVLGLLGVEKESVDEIIGEPTVEWRLGEPAYMLPTGEYDTSDIKAAELAKKIMGEAD